MFANIEFTDETHNVVAGFASPGIPQFSYETPNVASPGIPQFSYETPNVVSPGIPQYPKHKMPLMNIPPIVYSNESMDKATKQDTKDIPSSSSFAHFMKSLVGSSTDNKFVQPTVQKKVSFVKNNQGEFVAVPYDSKQNGDFVEITGNPKTEGTMFYAKPINNPATKKSKKSRDDDDDDSDNEDTNGKKNKPVTKDTDDYIFHMYVGSLGVIGLLILFRIIQKS